MSKFKVSPMTQGGFDVAYGDNYFTFPNAPTPVAAAVAGMRAIMADSPGILPIDLVKSMDDRNLQGGVIKSWSNLVKSGASGDRQPAPQAQRQQQQFQAEPQPQARMPQQPQGVPLVSRNQAMAFLQHRIEELHNAQVNKDAAALQKTAKGYGGSIGQLEGPAAINGLIKSLNTTFIRISMMPAEIAAAAPAAMAQGQQVPTPEEYFQGHTMYAPLAKDVQKWLDAGGDVGE